MGSPLINVIQNALHDMLFWVVSLSLLFLLFYCCCCHSRCRENEENSGPSPFYPHFEFQTFFFFNGRNEKPREPDIEKQIEGDNEEDNPLHTNRT